MQNVEHESVRLCAFFVSNRSCIDSQSAREKKNERWKKVQLRGMQYLYCHGMYRCAYKVCDNSMEFIYEVSRYLSHHTAHSSDRTKCATMCGDIYTATVTLTCRSHVLDINWKYIFFVVDGTTAAITGTVWLNGAQRNVLQLPLINSTWISLWIILMKYAIKILWKLFCWWERDRLWIFFIAPRMRMLYGL